MSTPSVRLAKHPEISAEARLVRDTLLEQGLETPMFDNGMNSEQKYERIRELMAEVMDTLGLDREDDSLAETPHRIAKMYVREIFSGLDYTKFPKLSLIENKMNAHEMVKVSDIDLTSTCEHHFVTIDGVAKVAYIPEKNHNWPLKDQPYRSFLCATPTGTRAFDTSSSSGASSVAWHRKCCSEY